MSRVSPRLHCSWCSVPIGSPISRTHSGLHSSWRWLFAVILLSAFALVRHGESLAIKLGEPRGTLIMTLAATGIEVIMISAFMFNRHEDTSPFARDAMFAVVMIVLNGLVGVSLLVGGLRYHEQTYNLQGANMFLAVIVPLSVIGMVLPNFTVSSSGPTFSPFMPRSSS